MRIDGVMALKPLFLLVFLLTMGAGDAQAATESCGLPYPCRLQAIIDRSDWQPVMSAITAEMHRLSGENKENWSSPKNSHKGYVQLHTPKSSAPVCREFEVVSFMGKDTGKEKVTACQQADGTVTVK